MPAFLSSLVDILCSFLFEWIAFVPLFFPLWFCSSPFCPKLCSFLTAFILPFSFSYRFWVKMKNTPLKGAGCIGFYNWINSDCQISIYTALGVTGITNSVHLYWGPFTLVDTLQSFFLRSLQTEYFPNNTSMEVLQSVFMYGSYIIIQEISSFIARCCSTRRDNNWHFFLITAPWDCPCVCIW